MSSVFVTILNIKLVDGLNRTDQSAAPVGVVGYFDYFDAVN
jgi:hypothetical protein